MAAKNMMPNSPTRYKRALGPLFTGMQNKWYLDEIYGFLIIRPYERLSSFLAHQIDWTFWHDWVHDAGIAAGFRGLANFLANPVDLGVIDGIANGLAKATKGSAGALRLLQTGFVRNYALMVFLGVVAILSFLIFR